MLIFQLKSLIFQLKSLIFHENHLFLMKTSLRTPPRYKRGGGVNSSEIERAQGKGIEFLESPRTYRGGRVFEDEHGLVRFRSAHG